MIDATEIATSRNSFDCSEMMLDSPANVFGRCVERRDDSKKSVPVDFNKPSDGYEATRRCENINSIDEGSGGIVGGLKITSNWGTIKEYSNAITAVEKLFTLHKVKDIKPVKGGQGTVYCYSDNNDCHRYAIKLMDKDRSKPEDLELKRKDICGLIAGENKYIVPIYAIVLECINNNTYVAIRSEKDIPTNRNFQFRAKVIISKYFDGSDLTDAISNKTAKVKVNTGPKLAINVAKQLVRVMEYLHNRSIFFQDLKPENIMINKAGEIKLVDFGLARHIPSGRRYSIAGSLHYLSPEILEQSGTPKDQRKGYTCKTDLWSLGITLIVLTLGEDLVWLCNSYQGANGVSIPIFASVLESMNICTQWFSKLEEKEKRNLLLQELKQAINTPAYSQVERDLIVNIIIGLTRKNPDDRLSLEEVDEKLNELLQEPVASETEI